MRNNWQGSIFLCSGQSITSFLPRINSDSDSLDSPGPCQRPRLADLMAGRWYLTVRRQFGHRQQRWSREPRRSRQLGAHQPPNLKLIASLPSNSGSAPMPKAEYLLFFEILLKLGVCHITDSYDPSAGGTVTVPGLGWAWRDCHGPSLTRFGNEDFPGIGNWLDFCPRRECSEMTRTSLSVARTWLERSLICSSSSSELFTSRLLLWVKTVKKVQLDASRTTQRRYRRGIQKHRRLFLF